MCTFLRSRQYLSPLEFQPESMRHLSSIITRRPTVLFVVDDSLQETELSQLKKHGMRSPKYHASSCCCIGNLGGRASTRSLCPFIPVPLRPLLEKDFSYKGGAEGFKPIHFLLSLKLCPFMSHLKKEILAFPSPLPTTTKHAIMDIDVIEESQQGNSGQSPRRPIIVPVDDAHPFDLEGYIANYTGKSLFLLILIVVLIIVQDRTAIDRLIHIVSICPSIATEAFQLCVQHIHQSRDPTLYQALLTAYEQTSNALDMPLPNPLDLAQLDTKWMDEIIAKNQAERTKLEVELKTYSNNMIKESIRVCACFSKVLSETE